MSKGINEQKFKEGVAQGASKWEANTEAGAATWASKMAPIYSAEEACSASTQGLGSRERIKAFAACFADKNFGRTRA